MCFIIKQFTNLYKMFGGGGGGGGSMSIHKEITRFQRNTNIEIL